MGNSVSEFVPWSEWSETAYLLLEPVHQVVNLGRHCIHLQKKEAQFQNLHCGFLSEQKRLGSPYILSPYRNHQYLIGGWIEITGASSGTFAKPQLSPNSILFQVRTGSDLSLFSKREVQNQKFKIYWFLKVVINAPYDKSITSYAFIQ